MNMNSKFLVLSFLFFSFGCAHSADVAKTDMPEDDAVAAAPLIETPKASRAPASDETSSCTKADKKHKKACDEN